MVRYPRDDPAPSPGGNQPHHISSIAHLFFSEPVPVPGAAPPAEVSELGVAAASSAPAAAFVAAGLALAAAGGRATARRVCLVEAAGTRASASTLVPPIARTAAETIAAPGVRPGLRSLVLAAAVDPGEGAPWVRWHLLGALDAPSLAAWEAAVCAPLGAAAAPGWSGLVWCLDGHETGSFVAAQALARLVAVVQPSRLEVLVLTSGTAAAPSAAPWGATNTLPDLVASAAPGLPAIVTHLAVMPGESPSTHLPGFARVVARLLPTGNGGHGARNDRRRP